MIERFSDYAPIVCKVSLCRRRSRCEAVRSLSLDLQLFSLAPSDDLVEWKLRIHLPLTSWVDNNVALLGDSAHATLPVRPSAPASPASQRLTSVLSYLKHIAQGAAMAGEDGAVLAAVLAKIDRKQDVHKALLAFEVRPFLSLPPSLGSEPASRRSPAPSQASRRLGCRAGTRHRPQPSPPRRARTNCPGQDDWCCE